MAAISPMEAIEIVKQAVALFNKIRKAPEEIKEVGERIDALEFWLSELKFLLDDAGGTGIATLRQPITQRLRKVINDIRIDAKDVYEILDIWYANGRLARIFFPLGRNPRRLSELTTSMTKDQDELLNLVQLLQLHAATQSPLQPRIPSPAPKREDRRIIFIDPHNLGRSKVAEAYANLLREWTVRTGGQCRVNTAHSAGIQVRDRSDCVDYLEKLKTPVPMSSGNKPPLDIAMASVFDNKYFDYPYKAAIKDQMAKVRRLYLMEHQSTDS
jgi:hypothetical protein